MDFCILFSVVCKNRTSRRTKRTNAEREGKGGGEKNEQQKKRKQRLSSHKAFEKESRRTIRFPFFASFPLELLRFQNRIKMGGGPISRYGALSTACGRFVLAPAGAALRVYSCSSTSSATSTAAGRGGDDASCSSSAAGTLVSELLGHVPEPGE